MSETNLLFLAPNWRVSLLAAFSESRLQIGVKGSLLAADSDPHSPVLKAADRSFLLPLFSEDQCLTAVTNLCTSEKVRAILPVTNKAVEFLSEHRSVFEEAGVHLYVPSQETVALCHDKERLGQFLKSKGIATPDLIDGADADPAFPLFAKRRVGEGGEETFVVRDAEDLRYIRSKFPEHLLQTFIEGREFSIDWFGDREGRPVFAAPRERLRVRAGEARVTRLEMDEGLIEKAHATAKALGLRGPCCLQGILDETGEFYFTDVNLRFGSGIQHTIVAGGDIPGMMYEELAGKTPEPPKKPLKTGSVMSRFSTGFLFDPEDGAAGLK